VDTHEVEDVVFGVSGEEPAFRLVRDGDFYVVYGETGDGRLLTIVGEFIERSHFRPFGARDMTANEKRRHRRG
jgi:uncharacterized DUF497 family protein